MTPARVSALGPAPYRGDRSLPPPAPSNGTGGPAVETPARTVRTGGQRGRTEMHRELYRRAETYRGVHKRMYIDAYGRTEPHREV